MVSFPFFSSKVSTTSFYDLKHSATQLQIDHSKGKMLTCGADNMVKVISKYYFIFIIFTYKMVFFSISTKDKFFYFVSFHRFGMSKNF